MGDTQERGKLIVIDGIDGLGKTTLCKRIQLGTKGPQPVLCRFPSDEWMGRIIREYLSDKRRILDERSLLYLYAADGMECAQAIENCLDSGRNIICDRHPVLPAFVYQSPLHSLQEIGSVVETLCKAFFPDWIFVLDGPPELAVQRMALRGDEKEIFEDAPLEVWERRREQYLNIAAIASTSWSRYSVAIDAGYPADELADQIIELAGL